MKKIGELEFPENADESKVWVKTSRHVALHMKVMCVAHTRIEGAWRAYCAPVPGEYHEHELEPVFEWGETIPEKIALAIFPLFTGIPYAK